MRSVRISGLIISLAINSLLQAQDSTPKYSNEFLQLGVGARAFGMGLSVTSHSSDVTAGYWNPAGLTGMPEKYQLSLMHSSYFAGLSNYDYGAFGIQLDTSSAVAISVIRFAVDDIADTRFLIDPNGAINYDNIRFFSSADYAFLLSYARESTLLGGSSVGGSVKIIRRQVGDFAGSWGFGLDMGWQKEIGKWQVGLIGKDLFGTFNVWSYSSSEIDDIYIQTGNEVPSDALEVTLPRLVIGGSRTVRVSDKIGLLASLDLINTFDGERNTLLKTSLISLDPALGLEFDFKRLFFLRGGIRQFQQIKDFDGTQSWSFQPNLGIGFRLNELSIDYAFTDIGDQAAGLYSHVFSVKVDFRANE